MPGQYRRVPVVPLNLGLNDSSSPLALRDGEAADCQNVHFDDDAISPVGGAVKLNNQAAPRAALLTSTDPSLTGIQIGLSDVSGDETSQSVPLRGYGYLPYNPDTDIGGSKLVVSGHRSFQQGRDFDLKVSFKVPESEVLYDKDQRGLIAPAVGAGDAALEASETRYDETLDECFIVIQKGGDRTAAMSWALGVVNLGAIETINGSGIAATRPSNYALAFMWYDHPAFGQDTVTTPMRYNLTNPSASNSGEFSTSAFRCVIAEKFIVPGRTYHVSVSLTLDSADVQTDTTWNNDGNFNIRVREDFGDLEEFTHDNLSTVGLHVFKGPQDSLEYMRKYGIRYEGKDALFLGLGMRCHPWADVGFIPYGADACPLEHAGFQMVDRSTHTINRGAGNSDLYPNTAHTLTGTRAANRFDVNHVGLTSGNTNGGHDPLRGPGLPWGGLANGASANYNAEALRGYRVIPVNDGSGSVQANGRGAVYTVTSVSDSGGPPYADELNVTPDPSGNTDLDALGHSIILYALRWHQRPLVIGDVRIYDVQLDYTDPRTVQSLRSEVNLDDDLEPNKANLVAYYPLTDAGGGVLRELVRGAHGYRAPFETPTNECGCRGEKQLFLSGEGEALFLDLAENPVAAREFLQNLEDADGGWAIEVTMTIPEAYYGVRHTLASTDIIGRYAPILAAWEIRDPEESGQATPPKPLMRFGHRLRVASGDAAAFAGPASFQLQVHEGADQEDGELPVSVPAWSGGSNQWSDDAEWVGQTITMQFGVQPQGDEIYDIYIAATPKDRLKPEDGDPRDAEMAVFSTNVTVRKKDLLRSVITIGGAWDPIQRDLTNDGFELGYSEMNARVIIDEVRVFAAAAPGMLAAINSTGRGKLKGINALPSEELDFETLVQPVGGSVTTATVTEGSVLVRAPGNMRFYGGEKRAEASIRALRGTYLVIAGDDFQLNNLETEPDFYNEFYWVDNVSTDGSVATLLTPYGDLSRANAAAGSFRLFGYTALRDRIDNRPLTLGGGAGFRAGVSTTSDAALTRTLFTNISPISSLSIRGGERRAGWRMRIFSPLAAQNATGFRSKWTRGLSIPKWNEILGVHSLNDTIYAGAQGGLFQVDDRWRREGPNEELEHSVLIRSRKDRNGVWFPHARDRILCVTAADNVWPYATVAKHDDKIWRFDAWVYLTSVEGIQTIMWLGYDGADPTAPPSTTAAGKQLGWWFRLNSGRPEFVLNTDRAGSVTTPEDGRYIATSLTSIPPNDWVHVRCEVGHENLGGGNHDVQIPTFFINGRQSSSSVNAQDTLAAPAGNWIRATGKGGGIPASGAYLLVGCAFDFARQRPEDDLFDQDAWFGENIKGRTQVGFIHSLNGQVAQVKVWSDDAPMGGGGGGSPNFDPNDPDPMPGCNHFRLNLEEGVGHRVTDSADNFTTTPTPCLIESHPFLSLWHEFGWSPERVSFANALDEVFCANGGRVVTIEGGEARPAGVLSPTVPPTFELDRNPLWKVNSSTPDIENEPAGQDPDTTAERQNHYSTLGLNYMRQQYHSEMLWTKEDSSATHDFLYFKCLVKMRDTSGRIQLWGMRDSIENGKAIEIVGGKLRFIFFDSFLKKNVWIQTTKPVINTGSVHYIYLRKKWPQRDPADGNWVNSIYGAGNMFVCEFDALNGTLSPGDYVSWNGAAGTNKGTVQRISYDAGTTNGEIEILLDTMAASTMLPVNNDVIALDGSNDVTVDTTGARSGNAVSVHEPINDSLVVRRFPTSASRETEWDAKADNATYNCISFTELEGTHPNHTATGRVSPHGLWVDITTAASSNCTDGATSNKAHGIFHKDMIGMYLQTENGTIFRIANVVSANTLTLEDLDGGAPAGAETDVQAAVFLGVGLEPESQWDEADHPDDSVYDIDFMGTAIQQNPTNGLTQFKGEVWDFAYDADTIANGAEPDFFYLFTTKVTWFSVAPTDRIEAGTDMFESPIYSDPPPVYQSARTLGYAASGKNFTQVASTQPNEELEIEQGTYGSARADSLFWTNISPTPLLAGTRRVRVTFYDPRNNIESNPGPELLIIAEGEDKVNPSGETRLRLKGLPISPDGEHIQRWIYMSLLDSLQLFRIQVIPDNTSSEISVFEDEATVASGPPLRFDQAAPPEAAYVSFSQGSMWYAKLGSDQGDEASYVYSLPFRPHSVPLINLSVLNSGANAPITGMVEHQGAMLIFKRNAIWRILIGQGALPIERRITFDGTGAVSHQSIAVLEERVYFLSNRGPSMISSANRPDYLGDRMEKFTNETLDPRSLGDVSAAINRKRNQYVWTAQRDADSYRRDCFSIEFDHELAGVLPRIKAPALHRISRYRDPNLTALAEVDRSEGGVRVLIGGTREGFLCYLDRDETSRMMMGVDQTLWGSALITATGASTTSTIVTTDSVDTTLESLSGVPIRWREADDTEREGLGAWAVNVGGTTTIYLDDDAAAAPAANQVVGLGFVKHLWRSKAFDVDTADLLKVWHYLDVLRDKESAGTLRVRFFRNREATSVFQKSIDLTEVIGELEIGSLQSKILEFEIDSQVPTVANGVAELDFELVKIILRLAETDIR